MTQQLLQRYLEDDGKYDRMLMTNDIEGARPRRFIKDYKAAFHSYFDSAYNGRSKSEKKEVIIKNASEVINNTFSNTNSPKKNVKKLYIIILNFLQKCFLMNKKRIWGSSN